ncbi:MAG TPA: ABC transporter permease subunit [Ilumatobacter sp.]|nr:ABC transporter permease subunit [Ilumatobacter sp.]
MPPASDPPAKPSPPSPQSPNTPTASPQPGETRPATIKPRLFSVGGLLSGAVIIEQLFALPGLGGMMVNAIFARDYIVVQGGVLVIAVGFVIVNTAVDLLYMALDPRTRGE